MGLNYWPAPVGAVRPVAKDRDLVGEMLAALRARGIAPAAYHTVIFDNWACEDHPEWAIVPATTPKGHGSHLFGPKYGTACANKPEHRAYEREQITALLQRYDFGAASPASTAVYPLIGAGEPITWPYVMAGSLILGTPAVLAVVFFQRFIRTGLSAGGLVG
jgi:hypothetical protein